MYGIEGNILTNSTGQNYKPAATAHRASIGYDPFYKPERGRFADLVDIWYVSKPSWPKRKAGT
jgi:hypothetical protein